MRSLSISAFAAVLLSGCATITSGTTQTVDVRSYPPGAACTLVRGGKVIAVADPTPQKVTLRRGLRDVELRCSKKGYDDGHGVLHSDMHEAALGNVLAGGIVGGVVDASTGAMGVYRKGVRVSLRKRVEQPDAPPSVTKKKRAKKIVVAQSDIAETKIALQTKRPTKTEIAGRLDDGNQPPSRRIEPAIAVTRTPKIEQAEVSLSSDIDPNLEAYLTRLKTDGWED